MIKYFLIGSIGGLLSGILGIGGGVVFVPLLTYLTKTDFKTNTGVSSLAVVFVATGSSVTYIFNDFSSGTNLVFEILIIIIGGIIGGYFGSKLTAKTNTQLLKKLFSILLIASAYRIIFSTTVTATYEDNIILYFFIGFVPTALTAAVTKIRKDNNLLKIGLIIGIFGVLGSVIGGSLAFSIIPRDTLSISFGIFLTLVSVNMFISNK